MFGMRPYNYESFTREMILKDAAKKEFSSGPEPGERASDFEGRTLDGDKVRRKDFRGERNLVLTLGSLTCPMTAGSLRGLNELYREYQGDQVQFLLVYVREAHPGELVPAHESTQDKVAAAERLRDEEKVEIPIIVDDLGGSIHRKYGRMPNSSYLIDKSGRVAYRQLWTQPEKLRDAIEQLLAIQEARGVEHAVVAGGEDTSVPIGYSMLYTWRALERGGHKSLDDFRHAMGLPGRALLVASRVAEPVALHPVRAVAGAMVAGGVIAGALYAGSQLRKRRLRTPYDVYRQPQRYLGSDYEAVGI